MASAIAPMSSMRALALRPKINATRPAKRIALAGVFRRSFADASSNNPAKLTKAAPGEAGPNMNQAEHVSEEAAKMAKATGGQGPDISQGTPVQDILKQEGDLQKNAPQVMKDELKDSQAGTKPPGTRSFSTMARRREQVIEHGNVDPGFDATMLTNEEQRARFEFGNPNAVIRADSAPAVSVGHKFPLPNLPLPRTFVKTKRYDSIVDQFTGLIMKHGKKATAQRYVNILLNDLRTNPPPTYDPKRPLLPGAPPAEHLPHYPVLYLTLAIDSIAPLLRIRNQRGAAGGGVALQIPVALRERQRRRIAIGWILDVVSKRKSRTSGNDMFPHRLAEEIVAVIEGRSAVWAKRTAVHRLATTTRMNVNFGGKGRKRF